MSATTSKNQRVLSPRAIEANRRNAQKSTGPRTEAGKQKIRLNAARHRITAQVLILPPDERDVIEAFCQPLIDNYHPEGPEELQLARAIAEGYWRLNQARAAITNRIALTAGYRQPEPMAECHPQVEYASHTANTFAEDANTLRLISLYEQRTMNLLQKQKRELETIQQTRRQAHDAALADATLLYKTTAANGQPWKPDQEAQANGGFVFSAASLQAAAARSELLRTAHLGNSNHNSPPKTHPTPSRLFDVAAFASPARVKTRAHA